MRVWSSSFFNVPVCLWLNAERLIVRHYRCDHTPSPPVTSTSLNHFKSWPVNHLVVPIGVSHISSWLQEIQSREWEKRTKNKLTIGAWVSSKCKKGGYVTLHSLCICRLSLTFLDWSSLTDPGPYLMPTGLCCCPLSTANCHSASHFANCLLWVPSSNSSLAFPCLLPVASRSRAQAFVWFRAKTDKGIVCLVDHPHSVTQDTVTKPNRNNAINVLYVLLHILTNVYERLVGFYGILTLDGLFYAGVSSIVMISNNMRCKNASSKSF